MGWFKVDDNYFQHPKVWEVGEAGALLNLQGIAYCSANQTDGRIPKTIVRKLTDNPDYEEVIECLIEARLWRESGKHYVIHDYLEHQSSRAQIRAKQKGNRDRKRKSRARHTVTPDDGHSNVRAPEAETDADTDTDVEADQLSTGLEDSSLKAITPQAVETQSPDGFSDLVASIGNGGVDGTRAAA